MRLGTEGFVRRGKKSSEKYVRNEGDQLYSECIIRKTNGAAGQSLLNSSRYLVQHETVFIDLYRATRLIAYFARAVYTDKLLLVLIVLIVIAIVVIVILSAMGKIPGGKTDILP